MEVAVMHFHNGHIHDGEEISVFDASALEIQATEDLLKWHDAVVMDFSLPPEELLGRTDISNRQNIIFAEHHRTPAKMSVFLKVLGQHFEVVGDAFPKILVYNADAGKVRDVLFVLDLEKELRDGPFYATGLRMGGV